MSVSILLSYHLELLPALLTRIFSLSVNVEGSKEVGCIVIKACPSIGLILGRESELRGFCLRGVAFGCHYVIFCM